MGELASFQKASGGIDANAAVATTNEEIPALTGLRFIAAISVAIAHGLLVGFPLGPYSTELAKWSLRLAYLGMTLFFVLSGFVIHYNYRVTVAQGGWSGISRFLWARFARLYPLFFVVLAFDFLIGPILFSPTGIALPRDMDSILKVLKALPFFLTFVQSWIYQVPGDKSLIYQVGFGTPPTWSISTEWFFYLAYPLICAVLVYLRRPKRVLVAAILFALLWTILMSYTASKEHEISNWALAKFGPVATRGEDAFFRWLIYFSPYARIGEFILGVSTAQIYLALKERKPDAAEAFLGSIGLWLSLLSVPVLIYLAHGNFANLDFLRRTKENFGLAPSIALIIFCSARYKGLISRVLSSRPLIVGGDASYSIYLIHLPVFILIRQFGPTYANPTIGSEIFLTIRFVFILGVIVLLSLGLYAVYEAPTRRLLRELVQRNAVSSRCLLAVIVSIPVIFSILCYSWRHAIQAHDAEIAANSISIDSATYGANCGVLIGNATNDIRIKCKGLRSCNYSIDFRSLGDPAPSCRKEFYVTYKCPNSDQRKWIKVTGEAGFGTAIQLSCPAEETHRRVLR